LLETYPNDLKLVIKHFPLPSHKAARPAAVAALASHKQGKFWEFHAKLFENYRALDEQKIEAIAVELGLDMEKFAVDQKSPEITALIERDLENGREIGVRGTPTIFLNGKRVKIRSMQGFQQLIEAEIAKAGN
jgi:protein-disulfide isomerase